jgi:hypothetical protein
MNLRIFRAWIFLSSVSVDVLAKFIRKSRVRFSNSGLLLNGSARRIAIIVGGSPADLLKIVLWLS